MPSTRHVPDRLRRSVVRIERAAALDPTIAAARRRVAPLGRGRCGEVLQGRWLGHALHPLLTDLPIGCWTSATLLDLVGGRAAAPAARRLVGLGLLAVPATAASGAADWSTVTGQASRRVGLVHAAGNTAASVLYGWSWLSRGRGHRLRGTVLALLGGAIVMWTGYLGGHLSFNLGQGVGDRGLRERTGRPGTMPRPDPTSAPAPPPRPAADDTGASLPGGRPAEPVPGGRPAEPVPGSRPAERVPGPVDDWAGLD